VNEGQNFHVFVDYAHTPDGLENVLRSLVPYKKNKLIAVFGCGGDRDRGKRPQMARIAAQLSDHVFVTSDNPRSEDPKAIAREVCAGFPVDFKDYTVAVDRKKAIRQALLSAREGDIVLLAGKGHETTQVVGDRVIAFSDREEARKVLHGH
jgi:UDP-N-acetylmuramoyl-L-alanyl-D-glutamate--2,6-diaminopimelate ligase